MARDRQRVSDASSDWCDAAVITAAATNIPAADMPSAYRYAIHRIINTHPGSLLNKYATQTRIHTPNEKQFLKLAMKYLS